MDRDLFSVARNVEILQLEVPLKFVGAVHELAAINGWIVQMSEMMDSEGIEFADVLIQIAYELARLREATFKSAREIFDPEVFWEPPLPLKTRKCVIWGRSPTTESIEMHLMLLDYRTRIETDLSRMSFAGDEIVIVDDCQRGPEIVANALAARSPHVTLIGSSERAKEVVKYLNRSLERRGKEPAYVPGGVDIKARNHDEIALSVVVEILLRGNEL